MATRILVTGGRGQLAQEIRAIEESGMADIGPIAEELHASEFDYIDLPELDITDTAAVDACLAQGGYDWVINCAAMTNVDGCETNREGAFAANARGPEVLAKACKAYDVKLLQISTDYVLSGTNPAPQAEDAPCNPQTVYGASKLAGEEAVRANCDEHVIVRTAWLYSGQGNNFVKTILRIAEENEFITVVDDQFGSPTYANDLAYEILKLIAEGEWGLYNCTGKGSCSWFEFAQAIVELSGIKCEVRPCTTDWLARPARRPAYSILDNKRLRNTIGDDMRPWDEALTSFMEGRQAE